MIKVNLNFKKKNTEKPREQKKIMNRKCRKSEQSHTYIHTYTLYFIWR